MENDVLLIITPFVAVNNDGKSYVQRELETLLENKIKDESGVKFFHPNFQGIRTLDRHIENYGNWNWNVLFHDELEKEDKIFCKKLISQKKKGVTFIQN